MTERILPAGPLTEAIRKALPSAFSPEARDLIALQVGSEVVDYLLAELNKQPSIDALRSLIAHEGIAA